MKRLLLCLAILLPSLAHSTEVPPALKTLPLVYEGRTIETQTFARLVTRKHHIKTEAPTRWLFQTLFNPRHMANQAFIHIDDHEAISFLGLPAHPDNLYSPAELPAHFMQKKAEIEALDKTPLQQSIARIQAAMNLFYDLSQSLSAFFPFADMAWQDIPTRFAPTAPQDAPTFQDFLAVRAEIKAATLQLIAQKGSTNYQTFSPSEQKLAYLSFAMDALANQGAASHSLRIIPSANTYQTGNLHAPWQIILNGDGTPQTKAYFQHLRGAVQAYLAEDYMALNTHIQALSNRLHQTHGAYIHPLKMKLETFYHLIQPLTFLVSLVMLGALCAALALYRPHKTIQKASQTLFILTLIALGSTLLARIYILERPPVGTLFESILFVLFVGLCLATYTQWFKSAAIALTGFMSSLILLILAGEMAQSQAAMPLLGAVLNTKFWLTVHVLCITVGYAVSLITSLAAQGAFFSTRIKLPHIRTLAIWSVFFTFIGTLLGGVWADQSWGRFWGWDPKENGALLLVLWLAWCLHLPYSLNASKAIQLCLYAATSIVVALSWFGVNLLGVGLHSYGFTQGIAFGLIGFVALQSLLILFFYMKERRHEH